MTNIPDLRGLSPSKRLSILKDDLIARWKSANAPAVEVYLSALNQQVSDSVALELIYCEWLMRSRYGPPPTPEEYHLRFPQYADRLDHYLGLTDGRGFGHDNFTSNFPIAKDPPTDLTSPKSTDSGPAPSVISTDSTPAPRKSSPDVPAMPEGYVYLGTLGRGGMGVVYRARHMALDREVALKMMRGTVDEELIARFRNEAAMLARVQHPGIVQIYDINTFESQPYFAMECLQGGSLDRCIEGKPQPARWCAEVIRQVADAMHAAHRAGVIHRDLKPANILLVAPSDAVPDRQTLKVTDFGLAKRLDSAPPIPQATASGIIVGTPNYMAPEQAADNRTALGPAIDIWAMGAILYECLTGRPPFQASTPMDTIVQVLTAEVVPPRRLVHSIPRDLETICLKCLEKSIQQRYTTAADLAADLGRFLKGEPILAKPTSLWEHSIKLARRRPALAVLVMMCFLLGMTVISGILIYNSYLMRAYETAARHAQEAEASAHIADENAKTAQFAQSQEAAQRRLAEYAALDAARKLYFANINEARLQWETGEIFGMRSALERCEPARRNWEWRYLRSVIDSKLPSFFIPLPLNDNRRMYSWVRCPQFSPNGSMLTVCVDVPPYGQMRFDDPGIFAWLNLKNGKLVGRKLPRGVGASVFQPDGNRVFVGIGVVMYGPKSGSVLCYSWPENQLIWEQSLPDRVGHIACLPQGILLVQLGNGIIRAFRARDGMPMPTPKFPAHLIDAEEPIPNLRMFDRAGRWLLWQMELPNNQGEVFITDPNDRLLARGPASLFGKQELELSPTEPLWLSIDAQSRYIEVSDLRTGQIRHRFQDHGAVQWTACFSPDGKWIAGGGASQSINIWDVQTGRLVRTYRGHTGPVIGLRFAPDGRSLASTSWDGSVRLWNTAQPQEELRASLSEQILDMTLDEQDRLLTFSQESGPAVRNSKTLELIEDRTCEKIHHLVRDDHRVAITATVAARVVERNRNDRRSPFVQIFDTASGKQLHYITAHPEGVWWLALRPDGARLAVCSVISPHTTNELSIWDTKSAEVLVRKSIPEGIFKRIIYGTNQIVALIQYPRKNCEFWIMDEAGQVLRQQPLPGIDAILGMDATGERLVSWSDGKLVLWNGKTGERIWDTNVNMLIWDFAFSPDGTRLAGATRTGVTLWDLATGDELLVLGRVAEKTGDPPFCPRVLFSRDGQRILATREHAGLSVWNAPLPEIK